LVAGSWSSIHLLDSQTHDCVVMGLPAEHAEVFPSYRRLPVALVILGGMVLVSLFDLVPLVAAVPMAALAAVFTRGLTMEDAYRAIQWPSLVLIAGMLPLADAVDRTGGTRLFVDSLALRGRRFRPLCNVEPGLPAHRRLGAGAVQYRLGGPGRTHRHLRPGGARDSRPIPFAEALSIAPPRPIRPPYRRPWSPWSSSRVVTGS